MALAEFYITDGTTKVNLLEANYKGVGIGVEKVRFSRPQRDSESIFSRRYKTVQETYSIKVAGPTQDLAIAYLRGLEALLLQAENYFNTTAELKVVWLVSRARTETNYRYALLMSGQIPEYSDIYQEPFSSKMGCVIDGLDLSITRSAWMSNAPANPKDITDTLVKTWFSTRSKLLTVGNQYTEDPLVALKVFDASAGTYVDVSVPVPYGGGVGTAVLPAIPAAGDIFYIGFSPVATLGSLNSRPNGLYVNSITPATNVSTYVWEYWNGAIWTPIVDMVDNWARLTSGTIQWSYTGMDNWAVSTINVVNALWIRMRVTAVGAGPLPPKIDQLYTLRNFLEISGIGGDIPALMDVQLTSYQQSMATNNVTYEIFMGLRSTDRGTVFYPWLRPYNLGINISAVVNSYQYGAVGVYYTILPTTSWTTELGFPLGRNINGVTSLPTDYYGQFRVFARISYTGTYAGHSVRMAQIDDSAYASGLPFSYGKQVYIKPWTGGGASAQPALYDLGVMEIGGRDRALASERGGYIKPIMQVKADGVSADTFSVVDIMLLPIDEWSCHVTDSDPTTVGLWRNLVGSASFFKQQIRAVTYDPAGTPTVYSKILRSLIVESSGPAMLQPGKTQRLYFLVGSRLPSGQLDCRWETSMSVRIKIQEMYLGLRGNG